MQACLVQVERKKLVRDWPQHLRLVQARAAELSSANGARLATVHDSIACCWVIAGSCKVVTEKVVLVYVVQGIVMHTAP